MSSEDDYDVVLSKVRIASAKQVEGMGCPSCGGSLKIQVSDSAKRAVSVMCKACRWRVVADGLDDYPPWVEQLGRKIETQGNANVS
jgi:hypothetical protein